MSDQYGTEQHDARSNQYVDHILETHNVDASSSKLIALRAIAKTSLTLPPFQGLVPDGAPHTHPSRETITEQR